MAEQKRAALDAHEAVEPVLLSRGVVTERGRSQFLPGAVGEPDPLRAIERLASQVAVVAAEVFAERVEASQSLAILRRTKGRDQLPGVVVGVEPVLHVTFVRRE